MPWRVVIATLLGLAAIGTVGRVLQSSSIAQVAGVFAALALVLVAVAVLRGEDWGYGSAFLLGLCWFWAAVAVGLQGIISGPEAGMWLAWSVIVMIGSVRVRGQRHAG